MSSTVPNAGVRPQPRFRELWANSRRLLQARVRHRARARARGRGRATSHFFCSIWHWSIWSQSIMPDSWSNTSMLVVELVIVESLEWCGGWHAAVTTCSTACCWLQNKRSPREEHFTPWQTRSIVHHLNFSGKHPAMLQLMHTEFIHKYPPLSITCIPAYSWVNWSNVERVNLPMVWHITEPSEAVAIVPLCY